MFCNLYKSNLIDHMILLKKDLEEKKSMQRKVSLGWKSICLKTNDTENNF